MAISNSRALPAALMLWCAATLGARASGVVTNCTEADFRAAMAGGGTVLLTCSSSITLTSALTIATDTVIIGPTSRVTLTATVGTNNTGSRLFEVRSGARLTLLNIVVANGRATNGGALHNRGSLVASNCVFSNNVAAAVPGLAGHRGSDSEFGAGGNGGNGGNGRRGIGGVLYNLGTAAFTLCTFSDNSGMGSTGGNGGGGGNGGFSGGDGGDGGNGGAGQGGAIYNQGAVSATNCVLRFNFVVGGNGGNGGTNGTGGIAGESGNGGHAGGASGGAIYNAGFLTLAGCTLSSNEAVGGNSAHGGVTTGTGGRGKDGGEGSGGGVANAGTNTVINCTFRNNLARGGDGGDGASAEFIGGDGGDGGGGRGGSYFSSGRAWLTNCTLSLGSVTGGTNGLGGMGAQAGDNGDTGGALGGNLAQGGGVLVLKNSILHGNGTNANASGTIFDAGYNLSSDGTPALSGTSFGFSNPRLGDLSNNGGPTPTLPLLVGSPAIDKIPAAQCPPQDQRGFARPAGTQCDMGAFEYLGGVVTGRVTDARSGAPVAGAKLSGFGLSTLTDANGMYFFAGLPFNTTVNVRPSRTGYQFSPTAAPVTLTTNTGSTNVNFVAFRLFSISGRVTATSPAGGLSNVTVIATSGGVSVTNVTAADGTYTLTKVREGSVVVTARRGGYAFTPAQYQFTIAAHVTGIDFTASRVFRATGRITDATYSFPVPGITVTLSSTNSVLTDSNGVYTFSQLAPGSYSISLAGGGYHFDPSENPITVTANSTNDFLAHGTNAVSGRITNSTSGVAGVRLQAGMRTNIFTDVDGRYSIPALPSGNVTIQPSSNGLVFVPTSVTVAVPPNRTNVDFLGLKLITLRGIVTDPTNAPISGVLITVGGRTAMTGVQGRYTVTNVAAGFVTVTPSLAGRTFSPASYTNTLSADTTNINFVGFRVFSVSGRVTHNNTGLGGVSITARVGGAPVRTNLTDSGGNFSLAGLTNATYAVSASLAGYRFTPASSNVVVTANVSGLAFTADGAHQIAGSVTNGMGSVSNVTITVSNATLVRSVVNSASGAYTVTNLPPAIYAVRATATGRAFQPASTNVDLTLGSAEVTFGLLSPITLSGRVVDGSYGFPVSGVIVRYDNRSTLTDTNGRYTFTGVAPGDYVIQPEAAGYEFSPPLINVTTPPSATNVDFLAVGIFSISGRITNRNDGAPLAGASVTANGRTAVSGGDGRYTFTNLPTGALTVRPSLNQHVFTPAQAIVSVPPNRQDIDFGGAPFIRISGRILYLDQSPLTNVTVTAGGVTGRTDTQGDYVLTNVPAGNLAITPTLNGYGFEPTARTNLFTNDVTGEDFTGFRVFNVGGRVRYGNAGLAGVVVTDGAGGGGVTTPAGEYTVLNVREGNTTFTPSLAGYRFSPLSFTTNVMGVITNIDFIATGNYQLTGVVTTNGAGLPGASLIVSNQSLVRAGTTDGTGQFLVADLPPGDYLVRPLLSRYAFIPDATNTVLTQAVTTVDFQAVPVVNISGRITDNTNGLRGITVQAMGALSVTTVTDSGGYYTLVNAAAGANTVLATNGAYEFEPSHVTLDSVSDVAGVDFVGILVYSVSGRITISGLGLSNVTVVIGSRAGLSESNGNYTVTGLRDNTYEVRPMLAGYAFAPTNVTVTVGPSTNNVNFNASGVLTISGRVLEGSSGVSNILITARTNAGAVLTDSSGNYAFSNLTPRTYLLSAQNVGVGFSPTNTVILDGTNATGINFMANPVRLGIAPVTNGMRITGLGLPLRSYRLQFATNGIAPGEWQPLTTRTAATNSTFEFTDTNLSSAPIKFYRSLPQ